MNTTSFPLGMFHVFQHSEAAYNTKVAPAQALAKHSHAKSSKQTLGTCFYDVLL